MILINVNYLDVQDQKKWADVFQGMTDENGHFFTEDEIQFFQDYLTQLYDLENDRSNNLRIEEIDKLKKTMTAFENLVCYSNSNRVVDEQDLELIVGSKNVILDIEELLAKGDFSNVNNPIMKKFANFRQKVLEAQDMVETYGYNKVVISGNKNADQLDKDFDEMHESYDKMVKQRDLVHVPMQKNKEYMNAAKQQRKMFDERTKQINILQLSLKEKADNNEKAIKNMEARKGIYLALMEMSTLQKELNDNSTASEKYFDMFTLLNNKVMNLPEERKLLNQITDSTDDKMLSEITNKVKNDVKMLNDNLEKAKKTKTELGEKLAELKVFEENFETFKKNNSLGYLIDYAVFCDKKNNKTGWPDYQVGKLREFAEGNEKRISQSQNMGKIYSDQLSKGKRAGHTNSGPFNEMVTALNNFNNANPLDVNIANELLTKANAYITEKKNGWHLPFDTVMRTHRLEMAKKISELAAKTLKGLDNTKSVDGGIDLVIAHLEQVKQKTTFSTNKLDSPIGIDNFSQKVEYQMKKYDKEISKFSDFAGIEQKTKEKNMEQKSFENTF